MTDPLHRNLHDLKLDGMPAGELDALRRRKANLLHDMACTIQDQLGNLPVYLGDDKLIEAKRRIDDACTKARNVADRIRHARTVHA